LVGGLSKFLSFVEKNTHINKFVTYCDLHYGNGNSYIKHMEYLGETPPNYYYTDKIQFFSRQKFQEKKLKRLFPDLYDDELSEREIMEKTSYFRYYDCGNKKFMWKRKGALLGAPH
jgi:hypothetical protein